jgi:uncharacterized protein (DUF2249 family)
MKRTNIVEFDVRPTLASGVDPFEAIMGKLKEMNDDQTLLVINTFEPIPLLNILKTKGYEYEVERPEDGAVYTYLKKIVEGDVKSTSEKEEIAGDEFTYDQVEARFKDRMHEIDVRDLEMPMPMVTVLEEVEKIDSSNALYVHHKKLPQYLLPELSDRGYNYVHKEIDADNLKLIIYR